ncbi:MAG: hypothetical protein ABSF38_14170 [Verrucomicrobiota bacterium]|jgi:type II secretory pathway pseudopilin PulG
MKSTAPTRPAGQPAFTMVEIAIALGVIGFALVAIIGVLPFGLNVQKESHQDTVVGQDGPFFLAAIRSGGLATNYGNTNLDFLTNYIEQIAISTDEWNSSNNVPIPNGKAILGALSTPEFYYPPGFPPGTVTATQTNLVWARVRALSGNALEQNGANSLVAFRYCMQVEVVPFVGSLEATFNTNLPNDLYEIHLKFCWPAPAATSLAPIIGPRAKFGPGRAHFRSMVSGQLVPGFTNTATKEIYWFLQPNSYSPFTNNTFL